MASHRTKGDAGVRVGEIVAALGGELRGNAEHCVSRIASLAGPRVG
jgi:hypothetical protein